MFFLGDGNEKKVKVPLVSQMKDLFANYKTYYLSLWYFITFGAFVAFGLFLPNYLVEQFGIDKVDAGIRSGVFIALATFLRPLGGIIGGQIQCRKSLDGRLCILDCGCSHLRLIQSHRSLYNRLLINQYLCRVR